MTTFERTMMIAEKEYALAMNEIAHASAIIESSLELNMQRAELKVLKESGTELDLLYLYEAAGEDAQKNTNQQGFFSKMAAAVKNFITKAWNAIQRIFTGKDTEAYKKLMNAQGKFKIDIPDPTEVLSNVENTLSSINAKTVGIGAAIGASIIGLIGAIKAFKKKEGNGEGAVLDENKGKTIISKINNITNHISSIFKKSEATPDEQVSYTNEDGAKQETDTKGICGKLSEHIKDITGWIAAKIHAGLSKIGIKSGDQGANPENNNGNGAGNGGQDTQQPTQNNNGGTADGATGGTNGAGTNNTNESVEIKLNRLAAMLEGL